MDNNAFVFETAMKRIEEIVSALEKGDVALDKSLALFQEGAELIKKCSTALDNAEQKVTMLVKGEDGPQQIPFDGDNV
ncbi:MAG: exodeoxyribonuclease VII small subunit [Clostridia bacterium]|nr:exodeoxyribonuclease VII small subunit [Clostridia bacterium]